MTLLTLALAAAFLVPPGVVIDHQPAASRQYVGSPSIVKIPGGDYLATHDLFGPQSGQTTSAVTRVFKSSDRGKTWRQVAEFPEQFWSNLFLHHGQIYLMGTNYEYGRIVIRRSKDGVVWSAPSYLTTGTGFHTAPVPIVEKDGRLWRAMEYHPAGPWGSFQAFLISIDAKADLLDAKNWTMTPRLPYQGGSGGTTWLEGNAVIGPDGSLLDILRVNDLEKAAITRFQDGALVFEKLIDFPGGAKKFTIRYDRKSHRYWTLSNPALAQFPKSATNPASVRNTLALLSSADLEHWTTERIVLSHPDPEKHAFQYVDWQFEGNDIIAVSRTAFDDEEGGAHRGHDANFMTFHRISQFRKNPKKALQSSSKIR